MAVARHSARNVDGTENCSGMTLSLTKGFFGSGRFACYGGDRGRDGTLNSCQSLINVGGRLAKKGPDKTAS